MTRPVPLCSDSSVAAPVQPAAQIPRNLTHCYLKNLKSVSHNLASFFSPLSSAACWLRYISYLSQRRVPPSIRPTPATGRRVAGGGACLFFSSASTLREWSGEVKVIKPQESRTHLRQTSVSFTTKGAVFKTLNKDRYYQAAKVRTRVKSLPKACV